MEGHGFKLNLGDVAQVLLALAALVSAWYGRRKAKEKNDKAPKE